jgi:hypothetical protein
MRKFNPSASHSARALQAWQILISMASNRQTTTYENLSKLMFGKSAAGVLAQILGHVAFFCIDNDLPPLTSIVVGKWRGSPGEEIPLDPSKIDEQREQVYRYDWYNTYPPTENDLGKAYSRHMK